MAAILDTAVLEEIQYHMLEAPDLGVNWTDAIWSRTEVTEYAIQRQNRFLKETMSQLGRAEIINSTNLSQPLPSDWMATFRLVWKDANGDRLEVVRVDHRELDLNESTWPTGTATQPQYYADTDTDHLNIDVVPIPTNTGEFEITYVPIAFPLTGTGAAFQVPEEFVHVIKYGVMADMLSKTGRGQDLERAAYCEARWRMGIDLANAMVRGFE